MILLAASHIPQTQTHTHTHFHMPLVIICGYPSSGKTTLALQLKSFLEAKLVDQSSVNFKNVQVVNEEYLKLSSNDYYMSNDINFIVIFDLIFLIL